ncbi:InlB B-repeat-containing protein [Kiritimatiella glycovorans]|uniref:Bacterial repeat domain-containing protein n=1 Tax=Kiritimatiella glycovorans TaxID=1307763 RepID=A0A0G3EFM8_9BACT|nr:hypothetical protein [Kiritimatiella glycovorans]AKJ63605.1 hypothetical protein L21SP4_00324 [Kiritimatiella glycovorans]
MSVDVREYGATPDDGRDDAPAFRAALQDVLDAGGGAVQIGPGRYDFFSRVDMQADSANLSIRGSGHGVTGLYSHNPRGVFRLTFTERTSQLTFTDLSFFADRREAGQGIELFSPPGGNKQRHTLIVRNVEFRAVEFHHDYFNGGLKATGLWRPVFHNVIFGAAFGPTQEKPYAGTCGIELIDCPGPTFRHCYMWVLQTGYRLIGTSGREPSFIRSFAVGCRTGILIDPLDRVHTGVRIQSCHINCRDSGILMRRIRGFCLQNNLMYHAHEDVNPEYLDIRLEACGRGVIARNIFHQPNNTTRIMISGDGDCYQLHLAANLFNAEGVPAEIQQGASRIEIVDNYAPSDGTNPSVVERTPYQLRAWTVGDGVIDATPDQDLFTAGSMVDLEATPDAGRTFLYWELAQGQIDTNRTLALTMNGDRTLFAHFDIDEDRYDGWRRRMMPGATHLTERMEDYDGDGYVNLAEYAFASDPRLATDIPEDRLRAARSGTTPRIRLRRARGIKDLSYQLLHSSDLITWAPLEAALTLDPVDEDYEWAVWSPAPGEAAAFYRVEVTSDDP